MSDFVKNGNFDYGPPPCSGVDWNFTARPGRALDACDVRLVDPSEKSRPGLFTRMMHRLIGQPPETVEQPDQVIDYLE